MVTYAPETGRMLLYLPHSTRGFCTVCRKDVLAAPRIRRSDAYPNRMFIEAGKPCSDIEVLAALRLDPRYNLTLPGRICNEAAAEGQGSVGEEITAVQLLGHSESRVRTEGLARSTAATWDGFSPLERLGWLIGTASLQIHIIEQLVRKVFGVSQNPFKRRKLLNILLKEPKGNLLPSSILQDADTLIEMILKKGTGLPD